LGNSNPRLDEKDLWCSRAGPQVPKVNKDLDALRTEKRDLRRIWQHEVRQNGGHSSASKLLQVRWKELMRKHNRLRRSIQEREQKKSNASQQRQFKADPMKFLFEKKSAGEPTFSAEEAFGYFSKLYRDE